MDRAAWHHCSCVIQKSVKNAESVMFGRGIQIIQILFDGKSCLGCGLPRHGVRLFQCWTDMNRLGCGDTQRNAPVFACTPERHSNNSDLRNDQITSGKIKWPYIVDTRMVSRPHHCQNPAARGAHKRLQTRAETQPGEICVIYCKRQILHITRMPRASMRHR